MKPLSIKVMPLAHFDSQLPLPSYQTELAAGADIRACLGVGEVWELAPGERRAIPTGLAMEIPPGYELQVRPRSGLALKTSLLILNAPGTVDADYRGEIKIILGNIGTQAMAISHGDRIAQLVLAPVWQAVFTWAQAPLSSTERGAGGFGSTGNQ